MTTHDFIIAVDGMDTFSVEVESGSDQINVLGMLTGGRRHTIAELCEAVNDLGAHEEHEIPRKRTTARKMFQVIRDLREAGVPIIGTNEGLRMAKNLQEIRDFADKIAGKSIKDLKSMEVLHDAMIKILPESRATLFDQIQR